MVAQERKYAARIGLRHAAPCVRTCKRIRIIMQFFNYYVAASGVPASVLNIAGNQPLYTDPMPLNYAIETRPTVATKASCLPVPNVYARSAKCHPGDIIVTTP